MKPDYEREGVRLYLGDCLEILPTLDKVDAVVTDPPYGHNNNNGDLIHNWEAALGCGPAGPSRPIANDGADAEEIIKQVIPMWNDLLRHGGCCCCCCCCGGGGPDPMFARWSLLLDTVFDFKQMIVWDKGPMGMGWHYRRSYETILVAQKKGGKCNWYDETNCVENIIRPNQNGIRKIIPSMDDHPTPKPVELAQHFIGLHTQIGGTVLDSFMGRGWVGIGAVRMGRKFVGIEIDKEHFDIAVRRIDAAFDETSLLDYATEQEQMEIAQ